MNPDYSSTGTVQESVNTASDLSGVDFSINGNWGTGYQGQIDITNQGSEQLNGWTLEFEYDGNITDIWNAEIVSHDNDTYVIGNANYNGTVEPNQEVAVGFIGEGSVGDEPDTFKLNEQSVDNSASEEPTSEVPEPITEEPTTEEPTSEVPEPVTGESTPESEPNFDGGGQTFNLTRNSTAEGFDASKDKINLGPDSIHNNIPVQTEDGLAFRYQWDGTEYLLEDVELQDLSAENFEPISDNHLRQDVSAILAWENGTGPIRDNTVYVRGHQEGLQETVDFDPATDKVSFFYYNNRGENSVVEETPEGVKFSSNVTGQSLTLRGVKFSDLSAENFEFRGGQVEDRIDRRMGLADQIDNMEIVEGNVFSGEGIARAGIEDPSAGYLAGSYPAYTGTGTTESLISSSDVVTADFTPSPIEQTGEDSHNHDHSSHSEPDLISMPDPATDLQEGTFGSDFAMEQGICDPMNSNGDMSMDMLDGQSVLNDANAIAGAENFMPTEEF